MATKPQSPNSPNSYSEWRVHVHPEEDDEQQDQAHDRSTKLREQMNKRAQPSFNRQVSLETGFSPMDEGTNESKNDRRVLERNGRSFGRIGSIIGEGKKGDFSMFRTKSSVNRNSVPGWSGWLESVVEAQRADSKEGSEESASEQNVPNAGRYFDALRGPELDQVKEQEKILLPTDELWPFLLRFPVNCFGICLGLASQSILWGNLATSPAAKFLNVDPFMNLIIWFLALAIFLAVFITYSLKCAFFFEAVRREYHHPVRVNFFFAPWIVCMFLGIGVPPKVAMQPVSPILWCMTMAPVFVLELKIYGQWLSGGKRRISKVVNPSSHLSVVGNFVLVIFACKVEWKEAGKFFWAVGLAHYLVVFVTLYQRLPSNDALPKELHPVYSMFIAAPSAASIAWGAIYEEFDACSRTFYFIALFLYLSLVVRVNFFWGFKFSVAWWAYTFPMTTAAVATIKYGEAVPNVLSKGLIVILSAMSTTMVCVLIFSTLIHGFVLHSLFPNDPAIAITKKKAIDDANPIEKKSPTVRSSK